MNKNQLVISRYDENLDWLIKWKEQFDIVVYNKGKILNNNEFKYIEIPNYGREAYTYLYHIVNEYDNLYENTIFLQGKISDIGVNVYQDLMQYIIEIQKNGFSARNIGFRDETLWNDIDFLADPKYKPQVENGFLKISDIKFKHYVEKYLGKIPSFTPVSYCGCFGVRKDFILARKKDFYENLLISFPKYHTPEEAHFLERMWAYIFTEYKWKYSITYV
jgi:hypothetical protein